MTAELVLPCGRVALLDDEDAAALPVWGWRSCKAQQKAERWYVKTSRTPVGNVYLHRYLLKAPKGVLVDHVDGNGLDNRRCNLRFANASLNSANSARVNSTGYRGVSRTDGCATFQAGIGTGLKSPRRLHLGTFQTAEEAARAFDRAAIERYGEFARLNFPEAR